MQNRFLVAHNKFSEVAATHLATLQKRARETALVHLDHFDKVVERKLLPLEDRLVLGAQIGCLKQVCDRPDLGHTVFKHAKLKVAII